MAKKPSGYTLSEVDIPLILAMDQRGDLDHNIAAWFGVNQGRIAEAKDGKWGNPALAAPNTLPPSGAPGIKGRLMRETIATAITSGNWAAALPILQQSVADYDRND